MQDGRFIVGLAGQYGCMDQNGKRLLLVEYDSISIQDGMIYLSKDGKGGLARLDGTIMIEPSSEDVPQPIPGRNLAIVKKNGRYGVVDDQGGVWVPFLYDWIHCSTDRGERLLIVIQNNKEGCLDSNNFSVVIPLKYDWISEFNHGMAVVELDGKYGVIDQEGNLVKPIQYEHASGMTRKHKRA